MTEREYINAKKDVEELYKELLRKSTKEEKEKMYIAAMSFAMGTKSSSKSTKSA